MANRNTLSFWRKEARKEILHWINDEAFRDKIMRECMIDENMGPYTKFLYYFAAKCQCGWGVMVDFNERKQRIYLVDKYYKWMHKLRDEIYGALKLISNEA